MASATLEGGALVYRSTYNAGLVTALKTMIPETDRRWDKNRKVWIVDACHGRTLSALTTQYLGETLTVPTVPAMAQVPEQRLLEVRYIGACRDRGQDDRTAYGWVSGSWSVVFPEKVLRAWFETDSLPDEAMTLYAVLSVARAATADELKAAYRRLARQWHPDVCKEPDAAAQFIRIKAAYDVLSEPNARAKYDAGLQLEASLRARRNDPNDWIRRAMIQEYRSPLRCGYILATGTDRIGRFVVEKIDMWEDIANSAGQVLVTSWPAGADHFMEQWA